jgi:hypothetical protein
LVISSETSAALLFFCSLAVEADYKRVTARRVHAMAVMGKFVVDLTASTVQDIESVLAQIDGCAVDCFEVNTE